MSKHSQQQDFFQTPPEDIPSVNGKSLVFKLRGFHIPSFKNSKMILGIRKEKEGPHKGYWKGTPFIATNTDYRQTMEKATRLLLSQFISASATIEDATLMEVSRLFLMCSLLPADDSRKWVKRLVVTEETVPVGQEGADITVTKL